MVSGIILAVLRLLRKMEGVYFFPMFLGFAGCLMGPGRNLFILMFLHLSVATVDFFFCFPYLPQKHRVFAATEFGDFDRGVSVLLLIQNPKGS